VRHICRYLSLRPLYLASRECSLVQIVLCHQGAVVFFPDCCATRAPLSSSQINARCPRSRPVCAISIVIHRRLLFIDVPSQQHTLTLSRLPLLPLLPLSSLVEDDVPSAPPPGGKGHTSGGNIFISEDKQVEVQDALVPMKA
jgi:hypothetical protein